MEGISDLWAGIWANTLYRKLILSVVIIAGTFIVQGVARRVLLGRFTGETIQTYTLRKIIDYGTMTLGLIVLFGLWVQRTTDLTVGLGLLAAGLAFALQEVIGSIAGWLSIIFGRPFLLGDRIETGGIHGDVIDIGVLRTTLMETGNWLGGQQNTGRFVTLSNAFIFKEPLFNYSRETHYVWDEVRASIPYGADWVRAKALMLEAVRRHPAYHALLPRAERQNTSARRAFRLNLTPLEPRGFVDMAASWIEIGVIFPVAYDGRRSFRSDVTETILHDLAAEAEDLSYEALLQKIITLGGNYRGGLALS